MTRSRRADGGRGVDSGVYEAEGVRVMSMNMTVTASVSVSASRRHRSCRCSCSGEWRREETRLETRRRHTLNGAFVALAEVACENEAFRRLAAHCEQTNRGESVENEIQIQIHEARMNKRLLECSRVFSSRAAEQKSRVLEESVSRDLRGRRRVAYRPDSYARRNADAD